MIKKVQLKPFIIEVGRRLRQIRQDLALSQEAMASTLFLNGSLYQKYETGTVAMPAKFFETCCTKHRVSLNWLIAGKGEKYILNEDGLSETLEAVYFQEAAQLLIDMKENSLVKYSVLAHAQSLKAD